MRSAAACVGVSVAVWASATGSTAVHAPFALLVGDDGAAGSREADATGVVDGPEAGDTPELDEGSSMEDGGGGMGVAPHPARMTIAPASAAICRASLPMLRKPLGRWLVPPRIALTPGRGPDHGSSKADRACDALPGPT